MTLAIALAACSDGEAEYPPKAVIKELLLEKYSTLSNQDYLRQGKVEDLECTRTGEVATCSYLFSSVPHTDRYMRNEEGHWELQESVE